MKKLLTRNPGYKIVALIISLILWFFVIFMEQSIRTIELPVTFSNIPADMRIVETSINSINVTFHGRNEILENLNPKSLDVTIDLEGKKTGEITFYISKKSIKKPRNITVDSIYPTSVKITLVQIYQGER